MPLLLKLNSSVSRYLIFKSIEGLDWFLSDDLRHVLSTSIEGWLRPTLAKLKLRHWQHVLFTSMFIFFLICNVNLISGVNFHVTYNSEVNIYFSVSILKFDSSVSINLYMTMFPTRVIIFQSFLVVINGCG